MTPKIPTSWIAIHFYDRVKKKQRGIVRPLPKWKKHTNFGCDPVDKTVSLLQSDTKEATAIITNRQFKWNKHEKNAKLHENKNPSTWAHFHVDFTHAIHTHPIFLQLDATVAIKYISV